VSANAKCSRCQDDTGAPCQGDDHLGIPVTVNLNTNGDREQLRFEIPVHLCLPCQKSMREWWDAGKPKAG
jgi:hypothetical protein